MHVVTHFLIGWTLADRLCKAPRDRALVTWAAVAPDLDGVGMVIDFGNRLVGRPDAAWYEEFHHALGHGLCAALAYSALGFALGLERTRVALLALLSFHLHLLCDLAGSRGSFADDIWTVPYLYPLSDRWTWSWSGQWPLTGWQNTTISAMLMAYVIALAVRKRYSPLSLFSSRADAAFVQALRYRWEAVRDRLARY
jgi:hypothetical protein